MIEDKLVRGNIEGNCEEHKKIESSKEKHNCDKSNFLTDVSRARQKGSKSNLFSFLSQKGFLKMS